MKKFNSPVMSIQFTTGNFEDDITHLLDIKTDGSKTNLYYKTTHTGQYHDFSSQTPWKLKFS